MYNNQEPLVSICTVTYNHENFIRKALDSILMQKVNFKYEIVVGEDCSTDRTREILLDYYNKFPDIFNLVLQKNNVGPIENEYELLQKSKGKYIALLEGDDYWTDEYKLQNQVDILEADSDYGLVYCDIQVVDEHNNELPDYIQNKYKANENFEGNIFFTLLRNGNFIYNSTTLFRSDIILESMKSEKFDYVQDMYLWLVISSTAKIKFISSSLGTYRRHQTNITSDPNRIIGKKAWEYSIIKGINYAMKKNNLIIDKNNYIYIIKLLLNEFIKSKYIYLKYLSLKLLFKLIFRYFVK